ncbi:hypothetical protein QBC34DRAFT_160211 [Podospora aff. communis PSN243]|uniref:Caspase family p20 domain-containing protein n=1 Tax=Podospora aff. communis PSN243 TaxID=3040156 RepID=A0AAV9H3C2_9PEZI|nr:hypothetical protein QBC34DRAFT_160211 [Podospora aff. communis PSN243]
MDPLVPPQKRKWEPEESPARHPESPGHDAPEQHLSDNDPTALGEEQQASDLESPDETTSLSIGSSTHDTAASSFHFESIHDFTKELQAALTANWTTRRYYSSSKYQAVKALLVSWEDDDLGVRVEVDLLGQLLERVYSYDVEKWQIPSRDPFKALDKQVRAASEAVWDTTSSLFILYYAGHARPSRGLGSFPRWSSKRFHAKEVDPRSVQVYLENARCDVLFLYDCCHSIHAGSGDTTTGVKEALAAGGFETIAAEVGEHSFTNLMINELARAAEQNHAVSVSDLHGYMLAGLRDYTPKLVKDVKGKLVLDCNKRPRFEPPRRRTPVHYFLSQKRQSILLAPLRPIPTDKGMLPSIRDMLPQSRDVPAPCFGQNPATEDEDNQFIEINAPRFPQVIVSVRLQSSDSSEANAWVKWLLSAPPDAEDIKVEGWFGSFSTLVILNIPLKVWHAMPDNPAVSFIGFVTTENQAFAPPLLSSEPSAARRLESKDTRVAQYAPSVMADSAIDLESRASQGFGSVEPALMKAHRFDTPLAFRSDITNKQNVVRPTEDVEDQHLPCPFRKRNRVRFNVRNHQNCALHSFPDMAHLK